MRLLVLLLLGTACGHARNPRMTATAGTHPAGYSLVSREAEDDLTFRVPPQTLDRCLAAARSVSPNADPTPDLSEAFSIRALRAGCQNELRMEGRATTALSSVRLHLLIGDDGVAQDVRVLPATTLASKSVQDCLVASARRTQFPKNFHKQPYEQTLDVVYFWSYVGETRWKMLDTLRRLDEPTRETCACMLDHPVEQPTVFRARFTLPQAEGEIGPEDLKIVGSGRPQPIAECYGAAIAGRSFYGRGASSDIDYEFKVLPAPRSP